MPQGIDPFAIEDSSLRATYAIVREGPRRVDWRARVPQRTVAREPGCRLARAARIPGDDSAPSARRTSENEALARWSALPEYIDTRSSISVKGCG